MNKPVITKLVFLCLGTLYWQAILADAALPRALEIITEGHELPSSSYSFLVQEIGGDKPLLCINPDTARNPASAIKIITTLAALDVLGPAYLWPTEIYRSGRLNKGVFDGGLLIKGYGDLIIDDSYFHITQTYPGEFDNKPERA